jgi:hypothetical protein
MTYRILALVAASVLMLSGSALAQKIAPTPDSDAAFHQPGGQAAKTTRYQGNMGDLSTGKTTKIKSTKSNTSDRMGAGGGAKGAVQFLPNHQTTGAVNRRAPINGQSDNKK